MANIPILTGQGDEAYLKASGTGTDGSPFVPEQTMAQATHDSLNANANLQVGDADVGTANPVPVKQATHDNLNANANLQVANADVDMANPVPIKFGTSPGSLPAGSANIGSVNVAQIANGEYHIGQVSGHAAVLEVTLTLDTNIYADGDVLAATQAIADAFRATNGLAKLHSILVIDEDDQGQALDIYLLDGNVSFGTENAAVSVADADAAKILGRVVVAGADYYDLGGVQIASKGALDIMLKAASATASLYIAVVSRGTGTYTASGIKLRIGVEQY